MDAGGGEGAGAGATQEAGAGATQEVQVRYAFVIFRLWCYLFSHLLFPFFFWHSTAAHTAKKYHKRLQKNSGRSCGTESGRTKKGKNPAGTSVCTVHDYVATPLRG